MAKGKRKVVGSFIKSKDATKPPYLKMREAVVLKQGQCLSIESKKFQLESLERAHQAGKLSNDTVEKIKERIEKIPDFVMGEIILIETQE